MKKNVVCVMFPQMCACTNDAAEVEEHVSKFKALGSDFFNLAEAMESIAPSEERYIEQIGKLYVAYLKLEKAMFRIANDVYTVTDKEVFRKLTADYPSLSSVCVNARSLLNSYVGDHYLTEDSFYEFAATMNNMAEKNRLGEDMKTELEKEESAVAEAIEHAGKAPAADEEFSFVITPKTSKEEIHQYAEKLAKALFSAQEKVCVRKTHCVGCERKGDCPVCG